jgi:uroporphyrin-III C-methyltransferase
MMTKNRKVYLVGAGPGDVGLLTLKGREAIEKADCIIYDRLVNPALLDFANSEAELIYAGKQGSKHGIKQAEINSLLVAKAAEHEIVVRLKGGDPFVFGRGGEEALALRAAGLDFEIVPGVSSGIAAAAYAGIPVTHRGLSSSVAFVTGHEDPAKTEWSVDWPQLATAVDTLVVFMGAQKIEDIARNLIENGRPPETPLALVSRGTLGDQTIRISRLGEVRTRFKDRGFDSPSIIIIGEVVRLSEELQWFEPDWLSAVTDLSAVAADRPNFQF